MNGYPIREIFASAFPSYGKTHSLSEGQRSAANMILSCKTGKLGYSSSICPECGHREVHSRSCRNRNCPSCQAVDKERWVDARNAELIDGSYFHIVFTIPEQLNDLVYMNPSLLCGLLMDSSAQSVLELAADRKFLGAEPGIISILHTWGQELQFHPHAHCIVSGNGLSRDLKLREGSSSFFVPVKVLAAKFRGKFLYLLGSLYDSRKLFFPSSMEHLADPSRWDAFLHSLYSMEWNVHIKQTFNGNGNAIDYFGRYAYRVAISNNRILSYDSDTVSFSARDHVNGGKKTVTLSSEEFIRRFLLHVLPKGFHKIRYYGFLANAAKTRKLNLIFTLQNHRAFTRKYINASAADIILDVWGKNIAVCPCCGAPLFSPNSA